MDSSQSVRIALSPVQLAAVLSDQSVSEGETLSNRLWGGLGLVGGVVEMFGAGVLCIAPEPTTLTKIGCVVVGTHSLDTVQASVRQVWTGRQTNTETYNSAVSLAEELGADPRTAVNIGMSVELVIPIGFALAAGAIRVAAVRGGRIRLAEHESMTGKHPGGHTLERHVGKTAEELAARLGRRNDLPSASSFRSTAEAEKLISRVLSEHRYEIEAWVKHSPSGIPARKRLLQSFRSQTGIVIYRGAREARPCYKVRVSLEMTEYNGKPYFILSAFPEE